KAYVTRSSRCANRQRTSWSTSNRTRKSPVKITFAYVERKARTFPSELTRKTCRLFWSFRYYCWTKTENVSVWFAKRNGARIIQTVYYERISWTEDCSQY